MKIKLKGIPQTLLISLRARYLESKHANGIINDPKTIEIMDTIDHDFSGRKEVSLGSQIGVAIRTKILDEQTSLFIEKNPDAVVVNLGCGLDTRFQRLDNGLVYWFDLDVPETIKIRKLFFNETERYHFISKSILDFSWMQLIPLGKPTLFIAEGLLMYFKEEEVKLVLKHLNLNFSKSEVLLEAMSPFIAKNSKKHTDVKKYNVTFKWGIKSGKQIEDWGIDANFINEWYYFDRYKHRQPFTFRLLSSIPAFRKSMKIIHLKYTN